MLDTSRSNRIKLRVLFPCLLLILTLCAAFLSGCGAEGTTPAGAGTEQGGSKLDTVRTETATKLMENNQNPIISSIGGEWLVMGVLHSGIEVPDSYYDHYYDNVRATVKSSKGVLSDTHVTEYERLILCLHALGKDPKDVEGYDMTEVLDNFEMVDLQGANAASFALICANLCGIQLENEEAYIQMIIEEAGAPSIMGEAGLSDYIAMAAEALSFYQGREDTDAFIEESINALSAAQKDSGAMINCEATAECIMALVQLGINPLKDERFIKNGKTLEDGLLTFYLGNGQFYHDDTYKEMDEFATEKALLAMDTIQIFKEGGKLYQ